MQKKSEKGTKKKFGRSAKKIREENFRVSVFGKLTIRRKKWDNDIRESNFWGKHFSGYNHSGK